MINQLFWRSLERVQRLPWWGRMLVTIGWLVVVVGVGYWATGFTCPICGPAH